MYFDWSRILPGSAEDHSRGRRKGSIRPGVRWRCGKSAGMGASHPKRLGQVAEIGRAFQRRGGGWGFRNIMGIEH